MTIPFTSFTGASAPRSSTIKLYGAPQGPQSILGFACNTTGGLSLQWSGETAGGDAIPLTFEMGASARTLVLPPKALPTNLPVRFALRACYGANPDASLCGAGQTQFIATQSPLSAVLSGGNTVAGEGAVTLDGSSSSDPDSEDGAAVFSWSCTPPEGSLRDLGAAKPPVEGWAGCLNADGTPLHLEAVTNQTVSLALLGTPLGANYTIRMTYSKGERIAAATTWVVVKAGVRLPTVSIQGLATAKVTPSQKLTLWATATSAVPGAVSTMWSVASADGAPGFSLVSPGVAGTPLTSTSLVINEKQLPASSTVTFRLTATDAVGGVASAEIAVPVSGVPSGLAGAARGGCAVSPSEGFGLTTPFTVSAPGWTDTDLPLTYAFAYTVDGLSQPATTLVDFKPDSSVAGLLLPAGDASGDFTLRVTCSVQNAFGAVAVSDPVPVRVTWDAAVLSDEAAQAALVRNKAQDAMTQVLSGNSDLALANIVGLSSLLNAGSGARHRRSRSLLQDPTSGEAARAEHRDELVGIIAQAVSDSLPSTAVRNTVLVSPFCLSLAPSPLRHPEASLSGRRPPSSCDEQVLNHLAPSPQLFESAADAVNAVTSAPSELLESTQDGVMTTLAFVAGSGKLLSKRAANSAMQALSSMTFAIPTTQSGRRRLAMLERPREPRTAPPLWLRAAAERRSLRSVPAPVPKPSAPAPERARPAPQGAPSTKPAPLAPSPSTATVISELPLSAVPAAPSSAPVARRRLAAAPAAPASAPSQAAPAASPAGIQAPATLPDPAPGTITLVPAPPASDAVPSGLAQSVLFVAESVHSSVQQQFAVPGEQPVVISTDAIHLSTSLDTTGPGSRLFVGGDALSSPAGSFSALPADLFAGLPAAASSRGVQTQFLSFNDFNPWTASGSARAEARLSSSLLRLQFSTGDGQEIAVGGRTTPIRFSIPAPAPAEGEAAVCTFYDPAEGSFRGEGCVALPMRLPVGHTASWLALGAAPSPAAPPPPGAPNALDAPAPYVDQWTPLAPPTLPPSPPPPFLDSRNGTCPTEASVANRPGAWCRAAPDAEAILFMTRQGSAAAERQLQVAWDFTGELFCGCAFTVLDCAEEQRRAEARAAAARKAGLGDDAAFAEGEKERRRVFPSPRDALLVPSVGCAANSTAVMKIFYGEGCAAWRTDAAANPFKCSWNNDRQAWFGPCCAVPEEQQQAQCSCLHLTDFAGGSEPRLSVASLDQMLSLTAADIVNKLRAILALVLCLFGTMHVFSGIAYKFDKRYQRRLVQAVQSESFQYRVEPNGAWTWRITQGKPDEAVGHLEGPLAELCRVIGTPVVRVRAAVPEELLGGDLASALGRSIGLSAEAVYASTKVMENKLRRFDEMKTSSQYEQTVRTMQQMAKPVNVGYGAESPMRGAVTPVLGSSVTDLTAMDRAPSVTSLPLPLPPAPAPATTGRIFGRSMSIMPSIKGVAAPPAASTSQQPGATRSNSLERIATELAAKAVADNERSKRGLEYGTREKKVRDASVRPAGKDASTRQYGGLADKRDASQYGRRKGGLLDGGGFFGGSRVERGPIPAMALMNEGSQRAFSPDRSAHGARRSQSGRGGKYAVPTASDSDIPSFPTLFAQPKGVRGLFAAIGLFTPSPKEVAAAAMAVNKLQQQAMSPPRDPSSRGGPLATSTSMRRGEGGDQSVRRTLDRSKSAGAGARRSSRGGLSPPPGDEGSVRGGGSRSGTPTTSRSTTPTTGRSVQRSRSLNRDADVAAHDGFLAALDSGSSSVRRNSRPKLLSASAAELPPSRFTSPTRDLALPAVAESEAAAAQAAAAASAVSPPKEKPSFRKAAASIAWSKRFEGSIRPGVEASVRGDASARPYRFSPPGAVDASMRPDASARPYRHASDTGLLAVVEGRVAFAPKLDRIASAGSEGNVRGISVRRDSVGSLRSIGARTLIRAQQPNKAVDFTEREFAHRDLSELVAVSQAPPLDESTERLTSSAMMLAYLFASRALHGSQLADLLRAGAEHFHGQTVNGYTYADLFRRFRVLLGPGNLFTKTRWFKRCRAWRLIFLMDPAGFWDATPGLAFALLAQRALPRDVQHLTRRRAPGWRTMLVIFGTDGQIDEATDIVEGVTEKDAIEEMRLCPITGFDSSAIEWCMPRMLRTMAREAPADKPIPAIRIWVRCLSRDLPSPLRRTSACL